MSRSQNGWTVDQTGAAEDHTAIVPGVTAPGGVRKGDVATVLLYVARRFHAEVEPLHPGWCWGWYVRPIIGGRSISNHASGTAIDLNAPAHPLGRVGTFGAAKRASIRRILAYCEGVVRWGGDFSGRKDEMHFEIAGSARAVAAIARKIKEDDLPTPKELLDFDGVPNLYGDAATNPNVTVRTALKAAVATDVNTRNLAARVAAIEEKLDRILGILSNPGT